MSIIVVAWDDYSGDTGELVEYPDRLRVQTLEVTTMAEEIAAGSGQVVLDDPDADFYIYGFRPMYFVETAAYGDAFFGIIGPFWTERRVVKRGDSSRTEAARIWDISVRDINSLLSLRVQKGSDAQRDAETDVERMTWLIATAEVIGGYGDHGYSIEETEFFFTDDPVDMSESDYTGQYSDGVINDAMQQSGANAYLYPAPTSGADPLRIGIWYGRTERSEFASIHKISNDLADVSAAVLTGFAGVTPQYNSGYVFPPSFDATLERDPSRQITGAMVQYDGDYVYVSNAAPPITLTRRDMVFAGELIKNATQALARGQRYVDDLAEEDDAVECSVLVPDWLVHAFVAGHRVQFKNTYMPGYEDDYVWMRVAAVTTRHITPSTDGSPGMYELALDLRAETPPGPAAPEPPGPLACPDDTPGLEAQGFFPLGPHVPPNGNAGVPVAPGVLQYTRAGIGAINAPDPTLSYTNSWHFPVYGAGGEGTRDYCGANLGNAIRIVTVSAGTITVNCFGSFNTSFEWKLIHWDGATETIEQSGSIPINGTMIPVDVPADEHCYHTLIINQFTAVGPGRFNFDGAAWDPVLES